MNADDTSTQTSAFEKADSYLKQHNDQEQNKCDRTVINTSTSNEVKPQNATAGFMQALEADANRRAEENKIRKAKADKLKEQGNTFFKSQNYEEAIKLYSEALQEYKLNTAIYTNRAQVRGHTGRSRIFSKRGANWNFPTIFSLYSFFG